MGFPWNWVRVGENLMEAVSQGELHWRHGFPVVVMRSVKSDWFGHIT